MLFPAQFDKYLPGFLGVPISRMQIMQVWDVLPADGGYQELTLLKGEMDCLHEVGIRPEKVGEFACRYVAVAMYFDEAFKGDAGFGGRLFHFQRHYLRNLRIGDFTVQPFPYQTVFDSISGEDNSYRKYFYQYAPPFAVNYFA